MPAKTGGDGEITVSQYIARYEPAIQKLIREARRLVKSVSPDAEEKAYRGWPIRVRTDRGLVAIAGFKDHVNVNFGKGARLNDPQKLLEGAGKSIRHVKVRTVEDAHSDGLRGLVRQELLSGERRMGISDVVCDRIAARVRKICLALPETNERPSHGSPTFFYRDKKAFLQVLTDFHEDGRFAIWCAAPSGAQGALVKADPDRFFVPPFVGTRGWLGVRLDRRIDWGEIERIIDDAYGEVAPATTSGSRRSSAERGGIVSEPPQPRHFTARFEPLS